MASSPRRTLSKAGAADAKRNQICVTAVPHVLQEPVLAGEMLIMPRALVASPTWHFLRQSPTAYYGILRPRIRKLGGRLLCELPRSGSEGAGTVVRTALARWCLPCRARRAAARRRQAASFNWA